MLKIVKRERFYKFELILAEIENDEKVQAVKVKTRPDWDNRVIDITIYYRSGKSATFSGSLSNHRMPTKYKNYVKQILKQEGR